MNLHTNWPNFHTEMHLSPLIKKNYYSKTKRLNCTEYITFFIFFLIITVHVQCLKSLNLKSKLKNNYFLY